MYLCAPLLGSYNPQEGVVHGCPFPSAPRRDVLTGWLRSTWQALLASTSLSRTLYSPRLCPPGPSSAFPFLCHCGFSHFIVPFKHLPLCMHTHTCRFLCCLQCRLARENFALSVIIRNVSAFLWSQPSRYFWAGRGKVGTLVQWPNGVSEGGVRSTHIYSVVGPCFLPTTGLGLEYPGSLPTQPEVRPQAELVWAGGIISESPTLVAQRLETVEAAWVSVVWGKPCKVGGKGPEGLSARR